MVSDDLVATVTIKLDDIFTKYNLTQWYPLLYNRDKAGSIHVEMQFAESGQQQQQPQQYA